MGNIVKPYNEHYMNCYLNNLFSICYSIEENCKKLSYFNDYNIYIAKENNFKYLLFDYGESFYKTIYQTAIGSKCENKFNIITAPLGDKITLRSSKIEEIIELLSNGMIVFILVDLFYFNNGNIFYQKMHREHFIMLVEWRPFQNCFISIDEGRNGYGYYEIKYAEIIHLLKDEVLAYYLNITGMQITKHIQINVENIVFNSNRICRQINEIKESFGELNIPQNYSELCHLIIFIQRYYNRQISNGFLIHEFLHKNYFENNNLIILHNELKSNWYHIRAVVLRNIMRGISINYEYCFSNILENLKKETDFWSAFKKNI